MKVIVISGERALKPSDLEHSDRLVVIDRDWNCPGLGPLAGAIGERRCTLMTDCAGRVDEDRLALALCSDVFVVAQDSTLRLSNPNPLALAGLVWRCGRRAIEILSGEPDLPASSARELGVVDLVREPDQATEDWIEQWRGARSLEAIAMAARLVRSSGGDPAERSVFASQFTRADVREGMTAFLQRRSPRFPATSDLIDPDDPN